MLVICVSSTTFMSSTSVALLHGWTETIEVEFPTGEDEQREGESEVVTRLASERGSRQNRDLRVTRELAFLVIPPIATMTLRFDTPCIASIVFGHRLSNGLLAPFLI